MEPEETAKSYDKLADHWASEKFNRKNGIAQHERALQFLKSRRAAIDIGCGSSGRIIELLLTKQFESVEGVDISIEMLAHARQRHPKVAFHQANICEWDLPRKYDFISAWDSIWHVPLDHQLPVLKKLCFALESEGVVIFTSGGVDEPGEVTNPCLGQPLYHAAPGITALLETLDSANCVCRHLEFDQYPEKHLYLIAQRRKEHKSPIA